MKSIAASALLLVFVFHILVEVACVSFPFQIKGWFFRKILRRGGEANKALSPEEQKIVRLEEDLHDMSIEYDIMRGQLYNNKKMHGEQRSIILSLKRDAEKAKRRHEAEIQSINEKFEAEKEIVVRNMQMMFEKDIETEREYLRQEMEQKIAAEKQLMVEQMGKQTREAEGKHEAEVTELKAIISDLKSKLNEKTRECQSATMEINKLKDQLRAGVQVLQQENKERPARVNGGNGSSSSRSGSSNISGRKLSAKSKTPSSSAAARKLSTKQGGSGSSSRGSGSSSRISSGGTSSMKGS